MGEAMTPSRRLLFFIAALAFGVLAACGDDDDTDITVDPDEPCPEGTYREREGSSVCKEFTRCEPGQYQSVAPTPTSDRECAPLSPANCIPGQVLAEDVPEDGSALRDRECCYLHPGEELSPTSGGWPDVSDREESCMVIEGNLRIRNSIVEPPLEIAGVLGDLSVEGLRVERVDIFSSLRSVGGDVYIRENESLKTLGDLRVLREIGGQLFIFGNPELEDLGGLEELRSIGGEARIEQNAALKNLDALRSLKSIGGRLQISSNAALEQLDGLSNLEEIGMSLDIFGNHALKHLDGLAGIKELKGLFIDGVYYPALYLDNNDALASLAGLSNLEQLEGGLTIAHLDALPDLSGLNSLTSIAGTLHVQQNALLCDAEAIALGERTNAPVLEIENNGASNPACD